MIELQFAEHLRSHKCKCYYHHANNYAKVFFAITVIAWGKY